MAAALRGWAESKPGPSVLPELIQAVRRAIGRWPEAIELNRVEAIAVAQAAEQTLPAWDRQRVEEAILTIRRFQVRRPNDRDMAVLLARLRLFGENNPEVAYQELGPIRDLESTAELTVPELELLGTIYRRLQKFSDAQRVLERANQQDPTHAGLWIELALTYHGQERTAEAQQALGRARALPRTAQQQSDYVEAIMLIQGGKR
jgi:Flp pilus assembly protein TadD